jgi:uncharacterized protein
MSSVPARRRAAVAVERPAEAAGSATATPSPPSPRPRADASRPPPPFLLDFLPREDPRETKVAPFFERLRAGRLSTTRCPRDGLLWPPRTACPLCHTETLVWEDLPERGRIYAFSAVLAGAPLGMEAEVPFAVGLVDLEGAPLRLFGRIVGRPWSELQVGGLVAVEPYDADDGRVYYRFRAEP